MGGFHAAIIPAGSTCVRLPIKIYDDDLREEEEDFAITIVQDFLPGKVTVADPNNSTVHVKVIDDDGKLLVY